MSNWNTFITDDHRETREGLLIAPLRIRENFMEVARNYSGRVTFAISDKRQYNHELRGCGYEHDRVESNEPLVCMYRGDDRFNMKMKFSNQAFSDTIDSFLAGNIQR